jgi:hypothetical protein
MNAEIGLAQAAQQLGVSWARAWRLVLTGQLQAEKRDGRWVVNAGSLTRLATQKTDAAA